MIDEQNIKALECLAYHKECPESEECQYYMDNGNICDNITLAKDILDLINRKNEEIERLKKVQVQYVKAYFDEFTERLKNDFRLAQLYPELMSEIIDELVETMKNEFETLEDFTELIKVKAYKEVAERLKENSKFHYDYGANLGIHYVETNIIDNLVKERVGEN